MSESLTHQEKVELRFDPASGFIDFYLDDRWIYDINLEEFRNLAEALDWIRQISQKRWATMQTISEICTLALGVLKNAR